jgi:hypothetical protein
VSSRRAVPPCSLAAVAALILLAAAGLAQSGERLQLDEKLEQKVESAVAYVSVEYSKPNSTRVYIESGSGFFVAPGYLVTNHHVIESALEQAGADLKVRVFSGTPNSRFYPAEVVKADEGADLALLHVTGDLPAIEPLQIHPDLPGKQTPVFAFGFPLGTMLDRSQNGPNVCLRRGYVSRMINDATSIEAELNIDKGISGGPLVDETGVLRGVIRAIAGSDYNKAYAGISVASPVLISFLQAGGSRFTLRGGQVVEAGTRVTTPVRPGPEPDPRPRAANLGEDALRSFFTIGSALRLSTLVPQSVASRHITYSADIRQSSRNNADLVLNHLKSLNAPANLQQRAHELGVLISQSASEAKLISEKAAVLEQACDEWVKEVRVDEKLNYDLGAWLTELSLGLLEVKEGKDLRSCAYFTKAAKQQEATGEVMALLGKLQGGLEQLKRQESDQTRRAIGKDADRLIGIGYLATSSSGRNPLPKPSAPSTPTGPGSSGNNTIRPPF